MAFITPQCITDHTSYSDDPIERYAQLEAVGLIDDEIKIEPSNFTLGRLVSNNLAEADWVSVFSGKLISSQHLKGKDFAWVEDRLGMTKGAMFQASKGDEPHNATEYSYDPMTRFHAMSKLFKAPKGSKSAEHLETLRQSNPCLSSLAPRQTLARAHELSYEPMERFAAMAATLRVPRGAKTTEHLAVLRASDPCLSSLAPRKSLPSVHELSYEPMERWAAMAGFLRVPRGAKTTEHLETLRQSDPDYGSLAPKPRVSREPVTLQQLSLMKRNFSVDSFACDSDDNDDIPELPIAKIREWRLARRAGDGFSDSDSERSAARTMERASNDTIESFEGEWADCGPSPKLRPVSPSTKGKPGFGRKSVGFELLPSSAVEQR